LDTSNEIRLDSSAPLPERSGTASAPASAPSAEDSSTSVSATDISVIRALEELDEDDPPKPHPQRESGSSYPNLAPDDPYRRLAMAVLVFARKEGDGDDRRPTTAAARAWLSGRVDRSQLEFWCTAAGEDWRFAVNTACRRWYDGTGCVEIGPPPGARFARRGGVGILGRDTRKPITQG